MQNILIVFIVSMCLFESSLAKIQSCSEQNDNTELCYTGKDGYNPYVPIAIETRFNLKEITDINWEKNSITILAKLASIWIDPGISLSNVTRK